MYQFVTNTPVRLRAIVLDGDGVDVDSYPEVAYGHRNSAAADCVARDDFLVEGQLEPGTYTIVVDSYVSRGNPQEGSTILSCYRAMLRMMIVEWTCNRV